MNVKAALSPDDLARACAEAMWKEDDASKGLGMEIVEVKPGQATLAMTIKPHMVNGQRIAHGGFIFTLADSAFAFACNSHNERAVAAQGNITFIRPGKLGDRLVATAREISRSGRSGIYDVRVTAEDGTVIAEFRGHSRVIGGAWLPAPRPTPNKNRPIRETRDVFDNSQGKRIPRRDGRRRARLARRDHGVANQAPGVVAGACLRQCRALQEGVRQGRRASVRFQAALRSRQIPVHGQNRSARQLSLQHVRGAARKAGPRPRLLRHHRQADRGRIYPGRYRHVVGRDGAFDPRRRRPHRHDHAQCLWLWPVHRRPRRALRRRTAGLHRGAGFRRHDRAAGAAHQRFQARHHHGDAELHAGDPRRVQDAEARPAQIVAEVRHLRRRALDQCDARRDRGRRSTWTRPISTACPK